MKYIVEFYRFLNHLIASRKLITALIKIDVKKKYLGSYLGFAWVILEPLMYILVILAVFSLGFRSATSSNGVPFFLWLLCGMTPWLFFADAIRTGTNSVVNNGFLVKKIAFRVSVLPLVSIGSSLFVHFILILVLILALILHGQKPTIYWVQLPYYILCTILFLLGFSWLTASIRVFVKDIGSVIGVITQMGFWLTPIFWKVDLVPQKYLYLIELNPAYYIIDGYRTTFFGEVWFWQKPIMLTYFSLITVFCLLLGGLVFKRLRPHFADVL